MTDQPTGHQPRRAPQPPRIAESDKPTDAEVESQRQAARSRFTRIARSR